MDDQPVPSPFLGHDWDTDHVFDSVVQSPTPFIKLQTKVGTDSWEFEGPVSQLIVV